MSVLSFQIYLRCKFQIHNLRMFIPKLVLLSISVHYEPMKCECLAILYCSPGFNTKFKDKIKKL